MQLKRLCAHRQDAEHPHCWRTAHETSSHGPGH